MPEVIRCPGCGTDNASGQRFCGNCGSSLERECRVCGAKNPLDFRFCGNCGNPLDEAAPALALREERGWATVVFADLSGFTRASEEMDPEDVRAMVDRCMENLGEEESRLLSCW